MFDLKGRKILITGASGGLGEAITRLCHAQGAHVAISGRKTDVLDALAKSLGSDRVSVVPCDLFCDASVANLVPSAIEAMGGIDSIVNNAGITKDGLMMSMKLEAFQDVIRVNLDIPFRLMKACLRPMLKAQFGRIVNVASVVGVTGNPGQSNYVASKAGLIGMSKSLAKEVASRNITVNCVAPGFIRSAMTDALNDAQKDAISQSIPMGKIGAPEDIAAAVVYLLSQEAAYVTGQTLHVNGGMAMV